MEEEGGRVDCRHETLFPSVDLCDTGVWVEWGGDPGRRERDPRVRGTGRWGVGDQTREDDVPTLHERGEDLLAKRECTLRKGGSLLVRQQRE